MAYLAVALIAVLSVSVFIVSVYVQPLLSGPANSVLLIAVAALLGVATFLAAVNDVYDLAGKILKESHWRSASLSGLMRENRGRRLPIPEMTKSREGLTATSSSMVYIGYSNVDGETARQLYRDLVLRGFHPWHDMESLLPGQDRRVEAQKAIEAADFFLACFSRNSVRSAGKIHKEVKLALDVLDHSNAGRIFIIPVRIDDCDVPDAISHYQSVDLFLEGGLDKLTEVLRGS